MLDSSTYIEIESYNMKNDIIGTYTAFDINIISKDIPPPNNKITKCTRRYDNFNTFYFKLIEKYPYKFFPKLSSKKLPLSPIDIDWNPVTLDSATFTQSHCVFDLIFQDTAILQNGFP